MSKNDDARPLGSPITPPAAEKAARGLGENTSPDTLNPKSQEAEENGTPATTTDINLGTFLMEGAAIPGIAASTARMETTHTSPDDSAPMTSEECAAELGVADLPVTIQRLLFAAPVAPVELLDRYLDIHALDLWLSSHSPFLDQRLAHAAGWLTDLLMMELALRPAKSRAELTTRIMILADAWGTPENGHFDTVCEAVLRADIARLGLPPDDPVVTHFESRMASKNKRKSEG